MDKKIPCSQPQCTEFVSQKGSILCDKCIFAKKSRVHEQKCKDYDSIQEKHSFLHKEISELKFSLEIEMQKSSEKTKENEALKEYKDITEKNIVLFMTEIESLRKNLKNTQEKLAKIQSEYEQQILTIEQQKLNIEKLSTENSQFLTENIHFLEEHKILRENYEKNREELEKLKAENQELNNRMLDLSKPRSRSNTPQGILKKV